VKAHQYRVIVIDIANSLLNIENIFTAPQILLTTIYRIYFHQEILNELLQTPAPSTSEYGTIPASLVQMS
jgi:hypothetical protein